MCYKKSCDSIFCLLSGFDKEHGYIVGEPGPGVEDICGYPLIDNHGVNLLSSTFTAILSPYIAFTVWSYYIH